MQTAEGPRSAVDFDMLIALLKKITFLEVAIRVLKQTGKITRMSDSAIF